MLKHRVVTECSIAYVNTWRPAIYGIHLHLRNPLTSAESGTTSYICSLRNPQQNQCADKIYVTGLCTRNPLKFCRMNPLTFWSMF